MPVPAQEPGLSANLVYNNQFTKTYIPLLCVLQGIIIQGTTLLFTFSGCNSNLSLFDVTCLVIVTVPIYAKLTLRAFKERPLLFPWNFPELHDG